MVLSTTRYLSGGVDANGANIRLTWEFDPSGPTYTQKANRPGFQPNQPGSAVALNALFAFGGGNPFPPLKVLRPSLYLLRKRQPLARLGRRLAGTTPQLARTRSRLS
jgi:hypothetical protein